MTLDNRDEYRPRPPTDGIQAEVAIGSNEIDGRSSYDLWKVFRDGRFYTLLSLFEDDRVPNSIFWEVRISRVTEALWFLARLYRRLGASDTDQITVQVRHAGLAGRTLRAANSLRHTYPRETAEESVETKLTVPLIDLETNLTDHVKEMVQPLFAVFDFFEVSNEILTEVVDGFINHTR